MQHVDDGRLHAYLDGALPSLGEEPAELERHLAACDACRVRLAGARHTHARAAALLREASPTDPIVPPFSTIVGRALAPVEGVTRMMEDLPMTNAQTLELARPRFSHLPASGGQKRRAWNSRTALVSVALHSALIIGAVYATVRAPEQEKVEELVEFMDIEEKAPEPEQPKQPEPVQEEAPPPVQGTQTLTPPEEPPPAIPAVDLSQPAVSASDFTGLGALGGLPDAPPAPEPAPAPPAEDFAYELAVLERQPELTNRGTIASVMERLYPRLLQDAGIGGTVVMQFVIEPDGTVDMESVRVLESSHEQLSEASVKAIERFRFRPGRYKGENVRVLIQMPITWQPAG